MSADNWATCPRCLKIKRLSRDKALEKVSKSYGKVSEEDFLLMRENVPSDVLEETTLREDWSISTDEEGLFHVEYRCSCDICGLRFEFNKDQQVNLDGK